MTLTFCKKIILTYDPYIYKESTLANDLNILQENRLNIWPIHLQVKHTNKWSKHILIYDTQKYSLHLFTSETVTHDFNILQENHP